ncbi:MAG TPA: glycosyltransferase family 2 protein [Pyrinomonadaceae bacterium]|nr:glycosyltransferase family 2 protein [Pyrinomonadaceae bacterium]
MSIRRDSSITVFFPAFNDAGTIVQLARDALHVLPSLTSDYEVLVVNDGSTDSTQHLLDKLAAMEPRVRIIHHSRNLGYGAALRTGFANSTKDLVFYTDGDAQYDVRQIAELYDLLSENVDIVNGYKKKRGDHAGRKVMGALYNQAARLLFRLPIQDVDCDFRLLRREIVQEVELTSTSGAICVELIYKLKKAQARFAQTPIDHFPRLHGSSQFFTPPRVFATAIDFSRLWLRLVLAPRLYASHRNPRLAGKTTSTPEAT